MHRSRPRLPYFHGKGGVSPDLLYQITPGATRFEKDSPSLKLQEDSARAAVDRAKAQLDELLSGSWDESIKAADAGVKQAEASLTGAEKSLKYYKDLLAKNEQLFKDGAVPEQKVTDIKDALENAQSQYEKSKAGLDQAIAQRDLVLEGATSDSIKAARAAYSQAVASMELAGETVKKSKILSPLDGTVLYSNFETGEVVFPGSPVMTILDSKNLWVKIYIPGKDLELVKLHQSVDVKYEDKVVKGEVVFISPDGEFTPKNTQAKEERQNVVYGIKIKLPSSDNLKPGMEVDVGLPEGGNK